MQKLVLLDFIMGAFLALDSHGLVADMLKILRRLSAAVGRQAVYGTARLGLHRTFSNKMIEAQGGGQLPAYKSILSSMASGAMGSIIGNPFDLSLVRMQTDATRPPDQRRNYKNVFDAITRVVREEGVLRLWRGSAPTVVRYVSARNSFRFSLRT